MATFHFKTLRPIDSPFGTFANILSKVYLLIQLCLWKASYFLLWLFFNKAGSIERLKLYLMQASIFFIFYFLIILLYAYLFKNEV